MDPPLASCPICEEEVTSAAVIRETDHDRTGHVRCPRCGFVFDPT